MIALGSCPGAFADTALTSSEAQPTIDTFRIEQFTVNASQMQLDIVVEFGYVSGTFVRERVEQVTVTDDIIYRNRRPAIRKADGADPNIFDGFPAAYQTTPATERVTQVNGGNFGGNATLKGYLEAIVKTLYGL